MTNFRFAAKNVFLTYAQASCSKDDLFNWLLSLHPTRYLCVGEEVHQDGGRHYHCLIQFVDKVTTRDERHFDFGGNHPNIQVVRNVEHVRTYCTKEDVAPREYGTFGSKSGWASILDQGDRDGFLSAVRSLYPRDYCLQYEKLLAYADAHYCRDRVPYCSPEDYTFEVPEAILNWQHDAFTVSDMGAANRRAPKPPGRMLPRGRSKPAIDIDQDAWRR